jgi:uncharacterized protein YabE (DUF348 family)
VGLLSFLALPFLFGPLARATDTRVVNLHIDDQTLAFPTDAADVATVLERAEVAIGRHDLVEPSLDTPITSDMFHINVYRARPVLVMDGEDRYQIVSAYQSPRLIAEQAGLKVYDEDRFNFSRIDNFLSEGAPGLKLELLRATPLKLSLYGTTTDIRTQATSVGELLSERGLSADANDVLRPKTESPIKAGMTVYLVRVSGDREVVEEIIPYARREIRDTARPLGYSKVTTAGQNGAQLVTYDVVYENGREVSRKAVNKVVLDQPTEEVVIIGADYSGTYPNNAAILAALRGCEGGYTTNTGNGFYGAYQFMQSTWDRTAARLGQTQWVGVRPSDAPPAVQDEFVLANARASSGGFWSQHPGCSQALGLPQFPY